MAEHEQENRVVNKVKLKYIKSDLFRFIHADGAIVDSDPNGNITINLFSQRYNIPDEVLLGLDEDGDVISESSTFDGKEKDLRDEIIREVDVIAVIDLKVAQQLILQILSIIQEYQEDDEDDKDDEDIDSEDPNQ